ncbi:MAG TPA: hypothetical protein VK730_10050 [Solirubrobacteraceae bacterium]|nr:hypothetical protein [Solirubrobacteraceae bacterium]
MNPSQGSRRRQAQQLLGIPHGEKALVGDPERRAQLNDEIVLVREV